MMPVHIRKRLGTLWSLFSPIRLLSLFTFAFLLLGLSQYTYGVDVTLSWEANSEEDLAGYRVFDRQQGQGYDYNNPAWESTQTTCTIYGLDDYGTYYFVVRAFDTSDNESGDSNEVSYQGAPPDPDAVLDSLSVTGTDSVTEGATAAYTATAIFSDGSSQTVTQKIYGRLIGLSQWRTRVLSKHRRGIATSCRTALSNSTAPEAIQVVREAKPGAGEYDFRTDLRGDGQLVPRDSQLAQ